MKISRLAVIGLAVVAGAMLLWLVGGKAFARHRQRQAERAWVQSFGTLEGLLQRYPKTATNDTALRLESLKALGFDLTPKTPDSVSKNAVTSAESRSAKDKRAWDAVFLYLTEQVKKPEAAIDPPPSDAKDFLSAHAEDLRALEAVLLAFPPPRWGFDPSELPGRQPIPDFYGLVRLQRALLAEALAESFGGKTAEAARALEASWILNQTLREMPDLSCQLVALAIARQQVGALRKVNVDADLWRSRLAEHDFKRSVFDAELLALWPSSEKYRRLEEIESSSQKSPFKRLETFFEKPHGDIVWAEVIGRMRLEFLRIRDSPLSDRETPEGEADSKKRSADGMVSAQLPNLLNALHRADSLVLDTELTDKVLEARKLRLEGGGKWPDSVPGIELTRLPGARWIYSVSPRGTMSLSLSREPTWETGGLVLPLCFTSS